MNHQDPHTHLLNLVRDFDTAMVVTRGDGGMLRGRPMAVAAVGDNGELFFSTGLDTAKTKEVEADPHVAIVFQGKVRWASLSGKARIVRDRELIHKLWTEAWKVWFPEGKDDPNICLLTIDAVEGEYWDQAGTRGVRSALEAAKAYIKGTTPKEGGQDQHAKTTL